MNSVPCRMAFQNYRAASGRGTGKERVVCVLLTSPDDVLGTPNNHVLNCLKSAAVHGSIGLYFYRFRNEVGPFIKIGECTRQGGISVRFQRGWHGTKKYADTYLQKKGKDGLYIASEFLLQVQRISSENPAYFVFYQHATLHSHPKIDEVFSYRMHKRFFKCGTASPERINGNPLLARRLVWHKTAFAEVVRGQFPDGTYYPDLISGVNSGELRLPPPDGVVG